MIKAHPSVYDLLDNTDELFCDVLFIEHWLLDLIEHGLELLEHVDHQLSVAILEH